MRRSFLAAAGCLAFAASALSQPPRGLVEGRYWFADAENRARIRAPSLNQEIDFQRDLGLEDRDFGDFGATLRPSPGQRIRFGVTRLSWDADADVTRTIEFDNRLFTIGTRVQTGLELTYLKIGWSWQFIRLAEGRFRLGPLVEGHGMWFDASIAAPALNVAAADRRAVGYPSFGLALDAWPHPRAGIFFEASGISLGDYGYFVGGEAGVRAEPVRHLAVTGGFRVFRVNPKFEPDYVRLRVSGPFVGAAVTF